MRAGLGHPAPSALACGDPYPLRVPGPGMLVNSSPRKLGPGPVMILDDASALAHVRDADFQRHFAQQWNANRVVWRRSHIRNRAQCQAWFLMVSSHNGGRPVAINGMVLGAAEMIPREVLMRQRDGERSKETRTAGLRQEQAAFRESARTDAAYYAAQPGLFDDIAESWGSARAWVANATGLSGILPAVIVGAVGVVLAALVLRR